MDTIKVHVGPKRKEFVVDKKALKHCGGTYFGDAITTAERKGQDSIIYLTKYDPDVFTLVVGWLKAQELPPIEPKPVTDPHATMKERMTEPLDLFIDLYLMAENLSIRLLQNQAMDAIQEALSQHDMLLLNRQYKFIFNNAGESSPIRDFCVKLVSGSIHSASNCEIAEYIKLQRDARQFAKELMKDYTRLTTDCVSRNCKEDFVPVHANTRLAKRLMSDYCKASKFWRKISRVGGWDPRFFDGENVRVCSFHVHGEDNIGCYHRPAFEDCAFEFEDF